MPWQGMARPHTSRPRTGSKAPPTKQVRMVQPMAAPRKQRTLCLQAATGDKWGTGQNLAPLPSKTPGLAKTRGLSRE
eukprot:12304915-Alexandrium_andersonii.AAC.2